MSINITIWNGRLGNNITQIVNAIIFANYFNINKINYPNHNIIKNNQIILNNLNPNNIILNKIYHHNFFSRKKICEQFNINENIFKNIFENNLDLYSILNNIININSYSLNLKDNDLVIHIRSGDVYSTNPHPGWVQPPLCFYEQIINEHKWDKIYLICEDKKSPVIKPLLNKYNNIIFNLQSLNNDIQYIVQAKNICFGMGSFIPSLLLLNTNLNNIYYPLYCERYLIDIIKYNNNKTIYDLPTYIKKGEWMNTPEQKKIMLEYYNIKTL